MTVSEKSQEDSLLFQSKITKRLPMAVAGKGIYLTMEDPYTKEKTTVIDGSTGAAVGSLGHGYTKVVNEIKDAVDDSFYSFTTRVSNYHAEELSQFICDLCPPNAFESACFSSSGSEANELNMKIAHQYHHELGDFNRNIFISRDKSYHGFTLACMNISGLSPPHYKEMVHKSPKVHNVYPYREQGADETEEQYKDRLLAELDAKFQEVGPEKVTAFITEPLSSSVIGSCPPIPGYLDGVRKICDKYGALMIADEVMCGSGRCGTFCTWEQFMDPANGPDLQSIGKAINNGFVPVSAALVSPKVKAAFRAGSNYLPGGQTYHSHAFNCKATLAVQKEIKEKKLIQNINKTGNYMGAQLKEKLIGKFNCVGDVRGRGGFWTVEFVKDPITKEIFDPEVKFADQFMEVFLKNGVQAMCVGGSADIGDHAYLAPAFILTIEDADKIVAAFEKTCAELDEWLASK